MVMHTRSISLLAYPVAVNMRCISPLVYPTVVYTGIDIGLVYPLSSGYAHKINITASVANNSNLISVPFTAYSTGLYPRHCEAISY